MANAAHDMQDAGSRWARFGYGLSIAGTLISRFATLAILILLPTKVGHTEYGLFALVITAGEMIEMTTSNWYRLLLVRQSMSCEDRAGAPVPRGGRSLSYLGAITLAALLAIALAGAVTPLVARAQSEAFALAITVYMLSFIWFRLIVTLLQSAGRQNLIGLIELLRGVFTLTLVMSVVYAGHVSFAYPAFAIAAATFLSGLCLWPALHGRLGALLQQGISKSAFAALGVPIILATLLTYQFGWVDRFVVQYWLGPQLVGLYVATMAIARQPIDIFLNALNSQTFPVLMNTIQAQLQQGEEDRNGGASGQIATIMVSLSIMAFGAASGLIFLSPLMTTIFLPSFDNATTLALTPWLAAGAVMLGFKHFVFDNIFHAAGRNWLMLGWFAVSSIVALISAIILVPSMGVIGAAMSFALGAALSLVSSCILSRRILHFDLPLARLAAIFASACLAGFAGWVTMNTITVAPTLKLLASCAAFCAVYLAALTLTVDFTIRQFLSAPWETGPLKQA